ncbi:MAG: acyl-CoA reductase [Vulcanimicrobiaceae bacterium]
MSDRHGVTALSQIPARRILAAIGDAAQRWRNEDFAPRVRTIDRLAARTGYASPVVEYALDALFDEIDTGALARVVTRELGGLDVLDGFVERPGSSPAHASPIGRVCIISSRTTIGVALLPAIFALLAKCDIVVKDRADGLLGAFCDTLAQELGEMRDAAQALTWDSDTQVYDLQPFDAVVAFGGDRALLRIRAACAPMARFLGFGPMASVGYITREALRDERSATVLADGAARDAVLYDGEGCLSLHALFAQRGAAVSTARMAELLAAAFERAVVEFPPGPTPAAAQARRTAAFRAANAGGAVYAGTNGSWALVVDPPMDEPPLFLGRILEVRAVDGPNDMLAYLRRHGLALEAMALPELSPEIAKIALQARVNRVATFGRLQRPPLDATHGGRPRIADFIKWVTMA